jgi:hypothetical protein
MKDYHALKEKEFFLTKDIEHLTQYVVSLVLYSLYNIITGSIIKNLRRNETCVDFIVAL